MDISVGAINHIQYWISQLRFRYLHGTAFKFVNSSFFLIKGTCTGVPSVYITEYQSTGARNSKEKNYILLVEVFPVYSATFLSWQDDRSSDNWKDGHYTVLYTGIGLSHLITWRNLHQSADYCMSPCISQPIIVWVRASASRFLYESLHQPADYCMSPGISQLITVRGVYRMGPVIPGSWSVHVCGPCNQSADSFIGPGIKRPIQV
jgi:hypothetical protein